LDELQKSSRKVQEFLNEKGIPLKVRELEDSTRTVEEAANVLGVLPGQIVKSMIFQGKESGKPILIIASGSNRVPEKKLAKWVGEALTRPDAKFVQEVTGFAIGGIPPVAHRVPLETWIDEDLYQYDEVWAAAGTPFSVFPLQPEQLTLLTDGTVICWTRD
jgi:Uncharacterized conserved protein